MKLTWISLVVAGCSSPLAVSPDPAPEASIAPADEARALAVADGYKAWGRVDDELRWAPFLCRQPLPGVARQSASKDAPTHGSKLYSVFAKDHAAYPGASRPGQVIVKESFKAEPIEDPAAVYDPALVSRTSTEIEADHFYPYARKDGRLYKVGDAAGLFVMMRLEDGAPDTDEGWAYATVSPDRRVTAYGRIAPCMGCHAEAPHGRLFGVPGTP